MTRRRVLIVNSHPGVAEDLGARLATLGHEVAGSASSGEEAIALAGSVAPDLVLINMAVDGSPNGVALADAIRRIHWTPVVFLGTAADEEELRRTVFPDPYGCLVPPFSDRELRLAIELALCRHGAARAVDDLESFFEVSLDMFCFLGVDGYFKRLNPAWETTLGATRGELMSRPFIEFVHPDDREPTLRQNAEVRAGGQATAFENRYLRKDGSYRWLLWNAAPFSARGVIYSSARDVTERKRLRPSASGSCASCEPRWRRSNRCGTSCPSACTARRSGTTRITGSRSRDTSRDTPRRGSATASVPTAWCHVSSRISPRTTATEAVDRRHVGWNLLRGPVEDRTPRIDNPVDEVSCGKISARRPGE